ncbi:MAG TPA: hydrogenase maturation nickel metallochaperone HypA [Gemmatimonadales bacterium]|jgi:Zn finger protein HypA/HybF involved in hydrogenase expression|nr:hydrogenase maturation nickel metallochaperone HypA [Gemmatimonadales bacterium]
MHELSLALEVCRIAEQHADPRPASAVRRIGVEMGGDGTVEVENFRFCLEALLGSPPFAGARLDLHLTGGDDLRVTYLEVDDGRPDD